MVGSGMHGRLQSTVCCRASLAIGPSGASYNGNWPKSIKLLLRVTFDNAGSGLCAGLAAHKSTYEEAALNLVALEQRHVL